MTKAGKGVTDGKGEESPTPVMRAKYLDYCSARVADVLLQMTADDMYLLAQEVAEESGGAEETKPLSFNTIVRLATERMSRELALPDFPAWLAEYRENPEAFERRLIGLWETDLETSDRELN
ncbi:MAG: hypothetical protein WD013_01020 [Gemmatimonadota bacterium]